MELNQKEIKKLEIVKKVVGKELTIKEATSELRISRQQIYRLINVYNTQGEQGFIHKNRGKSNPNKKEEYNTLQPQDMPPVLPPMYVCSHPLPYGEDDIVPLSFLTQ